MQLPKDMTPPSESIFSLEGRTEGKSKFTHTKGRACRFHGKEISLARMYIQIVKKHTQKRRLFYFIWCTQERKSHSWCERANTARRRHTARGWICGCCASAIALSPPLYTHTTHRNHTHKYKFEGVNFIGRADLSQNVLTAAAAQQLSVWPQHLRAGSNE